ncbi:unnamed protein product [Parnassius apollo]|uniref:Alanine aminotransferase 1 n=1 Tax=Parnassius apollo TaxID=110799 RepID=A0A8S3W7Y0_PARAO|nr:unnamed protein product [Parnassius apollo]
MSSVRCKISRAASTMRFWPGLSGWLEQNVTRLIINNQTCNPRTMASKVVSIENINPNNVKLKYAVCGSLVICAAEIEKELKEGAKKPYKRVIKASIGDAQAMGQKPITFIRQVLACVSYPELIEKYDFPSDVKQRAREILGACGGGSVGAYSMSHGIESIRRHVAEYIERRDGHASDWRNVWAHRPAHQTPSRTFSSFSATISTEDRQVGEILFYPTSTSVMIPIPQYPLYSASLAMYGLEQVGYYLDEESNWGLDIKCISCLVVINPGNPTGQVLTRENIESILNFAYKHGLLLFADEVYQDNIYAEGSEFYSFKKVVREMGEPYSSELELASFMSVNKGYMG